MANNEQLKLQTFEPDTNNLLNYSVSASDYEKVLPSLKFLQTQANQTNHWFKFTASYEPSEDSYYITIAFNKNAATQTISGNKAMPIHIFAEITKAGRNAVKNKNKLKFAHPIAGADNQRFFITWLDENHDYKDGLNLSRAIADMNNEPEFEIGQLTCALCHRKHKNRSTLYVAQSNNSQDHDQYIYIGSSCIQKYFVTDAKIITRIFDSLSALKYLQEHGKKQTKSKNLVDITENIKAIYTKKFNDLPQRFAFIKKLPINPNINYQTPFDETIEDLKTSAIPKALTSLTNGLQPYDTRYAYQQIQKLAANPKTAINLLYYLQIPNVKLDNVHKIFNTNDYQPDIDFIIKASGIQQNTLSDKEFQNILNKYIEPESNNAKNAISNLFLDHSENADNLIINDVNKVLQQSVLLAQQTSKNIDNIQNMDIAKYAKINIDDLFADWNTLEKFVKYVETTATRSRQLDNDSYRNANTIIMDMRSKKLFTKQSSKQALSIMTNFISSLENDIANQISHQFDLQLNAAKELVTDYINNQNDTIINAWQRFDNNLEINYQQIQKDYNNSIVKTINSNKEQIQSEIDNKIKDIAQHNKQLEAIQQDYYKNTSWDGHTIVTTDFGQITGRSNYNFSQEEINWLRQGNNLTIINKGYLINGKLEPINKDKTQSAFVTDGRATSIGTNDDWQYLYEHYIKANFNADFVIFKDYCLDNSYLNYNPQKPAYYPQYNSTNDLLDRDKLVNEYNNFMAKREKHLQEKTKENIKNLPHIKTTATPDEIANYPWKGMWGNYSFSKEEIEWLRKGYPLSILKPGYTRNGNPYTGLFNGHLDFGEYNGNKYFGFITFEKPQFYFKYDTLPKLDPHHPQYYQSKN